MLEALSLFGIESSFIDLMLPMNNSYLGLLSWNWLMSGVVVILWLSLILSFTINVGVSKFSETLLLILALVFDDWEFLVYDSWHIAFEHSWLISWFLLSIELSFFLNYHY